MSVPPWQWQFISYVSRFINSDFHFLSSGIEYSDQNTPSVCGFQCGQKPTLGYILIGTIFWWFTKWISLTPSNPNQLFRFQVLRTLGELASAKLLDLVSSLSCTSFQPTHGTLLFTQSIRITWRECVNFYFLSFLKMWHVWNMADYKDAILTQNVEQSIVVSGRVLFSREL